MHSLEGGGTERTLVSLLNRFDPNLLKHDVVTLRKAGSFSRFLPDSTACEVFDVGRRSRLAGLRLARVARARGSAVIHARNTGCWFDAIVASILVPRVTLILGYHGLESNVSFSRRQRLFSRLGLAAGARFASVSEAGRKQLIREARVPQERIDVMPNGVDINRFKPGDSSVRREVRRDLGIERTSFVVGMVGTMTAIKRHNLLVAAAREAVHEVSNLVLCMVGDGPERKSLTRFARDVGLENRVVFAGTREDIPRMLAAMDMYVCCSDSEGMNNALLEALACGIPAVVTDVGDNALIVRDGEVGLVIPPSSVDALGRAIRALASNTNGRRTMGQAARHRATSFDLSNAVSKYEKWYRNLVLSHPERCDGRPSTGSAPAGGGLFGLPKSRTAPSDRVPRSRPATR